VPVAKPIATAASELIAKYLTSCPRQGSALDNNARPSPFAATPRAEERHKYEGSVVTLSPRRRLCLRCAAGVPSPGADVGGASPVPVQMWAGGDSTTENAEAGGRAPSQKTQAP
jgi:hypothetical protein